MARITKEELGRYFREWLKSAYDDGLMNYDVQQAISAAQRKNLPSLVAEINSSGRTKLPLDPKITLEVVLREGHDPDHGPFNLFEIRWPGKPSPEKLTCFVGHRFKKEISDSLRTNLRHILEPLNIRLIWAGIDMAAVGFFDNIIRLINRCDFCVFDNREAVEKPNVYIEMGIAYALKRPFIVGDYQGNRVGLPSDLAHINTIRYQNYKILTRSLYFKLPRFLADTGLRRPLEPRAGK